MATPIIQTNGSLAGIGTEGESRKDFAIGETITFTDTVVANAGEDHTWSLVDPPPGSALTEMTDPLDEVSTLVPDVTGTWTVVVTVGTLRAKILFAVVLPFSGMRMPALNEQTGDYNEAGNDQSYHPDFVDGLRSIDALLGAGAADINVKVTAADTTPGNLQAKVAAGSNISLAVLNPGANETLQINAAGGAATALATTGADVDVAAAAPPTAGQVLKATGATAATWQADAGVTNPLKLEAGTVETVSTVGADSGLLVAAGGGPGTDSVLLSADGIVAGFVSAEYVAGTTLLQNDSHGGFTAGTVSARYGTSTVKTDGAGGAWAGGYCRDIGTGLATILAYGRGGVAQGYAKTGYNSPATQEVKIYANGSGSFARGAAGGGYATGGDALISAGGNGGFAGGHAYAPYSGIAAPSEVKTYGSGAFAHGFAQDSGQLYAYGSGAVALGEAGGTGSKIRGYNSGTFAQGYAKGGGTVEATAGGAHASGYVNNGDVLASGYGAFASGYAKDGGVVEGVGRGARAFGFAITNSASLSEVKANASGSLAMGHAQNGGLIHSDDYGAFAGGNAQGAGGLLGVGSEIQTGPLAEGAFAFGNVNTAGNPLANASIDAMEHGSWAGGYSRSTGSSTAAIETLNHGAFAHGACEGNDLDGPGLMSAGYATDGKGAHAFGRAKAGTILSQAHGSLVNGYAYDSGVLEANPSADGAFVSGFVRGVGSSIKALNSGWAGGECSSGGDIRALEQGAFAFGRTSGGSIYASGKGAFAMGYAPSAQVIEATQDGAFAFGFTGSTYNIQATNYGAVAFGSSDTADIIASATNAAQFGPGTNAIADSLQVGGSFLAKANGQFGGTNKPLTLGAAATTFATTSNMMTITGDGGANVIAAITGGFSGQEMTLIFIDALVTITDDGSKTANTVDLSAAFTSAADAVLKIAFNGTSWYEVSRSVN